MKQSNHDYLKTNIKVENNLKGSLDSIPSPSPSVKIQINGGKVCLRCKANDCWAFCFQKFVDINQNCFALLITPSKLSRQ